jgi:imidazolonepropionase-like amidohydrolase
VGGPAFSLKRAVDRGIIPGPRIYPSGAIITVTSGRGDFRQLTDLRRRTGVLLTPMETSGRVSSPFSPLDVTTFTEPELRAAVEIAENWGTYVAAHALTPDAIRKAIAAGVKCIEHGFLMD